MALTYKQLQDWKPEKLGTAADQLNTARKSLNDQQDEMDAGKPPSSWVGDAQLRAVDRHRKLVDALNDMAAPVSEVINALDNAQTAIKKAKDDAKGAYDEAAGKGWKVTFAGGSVKIEDPTPDEEDPDKDQGTMDRLAQVIADALTSAEGADGELAGVLSSAKANKYDGGTGTLAQASLPSELRNLSDSEIVEKMIEDPGRYDGYVDALTPEQQAALGAAIGESTEGIRSMEGGEDAIPLDDLNKLNTLLEAYGTDAEVSTGFLNNVGPKGLLELNAKATFWGSPDAAFGDDKEERDSAIGALQRSLGATLAAGTRDIGDSSAGTLSHVSTDWKWELLGAGDDKIKVAGVELRGFQALSPLLADGSAFDPPFLQSAAEMTVDYERNWDWDEHPEGPWDVAPGIIGDNVRWDYTQGTDFHDDPLGHDPIPGVLRALADNPEASRGFFSSATTYDGESEPYNTRVKYLLYDRADEHHIMNDYPDQHVDDGPNLGPIGDALKAATIGEGADERSVGIVETLVNTGYERFEGAGDQFGSTNVIPPEVRDELAEITGQYMGSIHHALGADPQGADLTDDYVFDDARFGEDDMASRLWLAELAKDDVGRETLRIASNAWAADQITQNLDGVTNPEEVPSELESVLNVNSAVLGSIDFGASTEIHEEQLTEDERHNARVDLGTDIVGTILGETPVGKNPVGGFLLDQVMSGIQDGLHQDRTGETNNEVANLYDSSTDTVQQVLRDSYWHSIPDDAYPEGLSRNTDLNNLTPEQATAYAEWLDDNPWGEKLDNQLTAVDKDHEASKGAAKSRLQEYS